jgi:hypothetical protein
MHRDDAFRHECGLDVTIKLKREKRRKEVARLLTRKRGLLK